MDIDYPVLITGGTGTIGHALVRRFFSYDEHVPITIFSRDPQRQSKMRAMFGNRPNLRFVLGDIRDYQALFNAMAGHETVIHAAAQKHIPQAEENPLHCIGVNVDGSINVAQAAVLNGVKRLVGISTDKAAHPINVYGHSKALMESIFLDAATEDTAVTVCRYGNVLGSNGSVLTLWQRYLDAGEALPITNPNMTRFWMSESDAVDVIMETLVAPSGSIIIPKVKALSIGRMAEYFAPDAEKVVVGMRPGEKHHECLVTPEEAVSRAVRYGMDEELVLLRDGSGHSIGAGFFSNEAEELTRAEFWELLADDEIGMEAKRALASGFTAVSGDGVQS